DLLREQLPRHEVAVGVHAASDLGPAGADRRPAARGEEDLEAPGDLLRREPVGIHGGLAPTVRARAELADRVEAPVARAREEPPTDADRERRLHGISGREKPADGAVPGVETVDRAFVRADERRAEPVDDRRRDNAPAERGRPAELRPPSAVA